MPADIILLGAEGLQCEVAALTGESAPVENAVDCRSDVPLEARNLVFASTLVVAGEGWGLVVRTGDSTLIGCIAGAAGAGAKHRRSLLEEEMARLVGFVCAMSLATGCIFLAIGLGRSLGLVFSITQAFILTVRLQAAPSRSRPRANERDELPLARMGAFLFFARNFLTPSTPSTPPPTPTPF